MTTVAATFAMAPALLPPGKTPGGIRVVLFNQASTHTVLGTDAGASIAGVLPGSYTYQAQRLTSDQQQSIGAMVTGTVEVPPGADTTSVPTAVSFTFA